MKNDFWDTLGYYLVWGIFYGGMLGLYGGTAFMPLIGTVLGSMFGLVMGMGTALVCALVTHTLHQRTFHEDTDLEDYSLRLTRIIGVLGGLTGMILLWITTGALIWLLIELFSWKFSRDDIALTWMFSLIFAVPVLFLSDVSAAYIASYYPAWAVRRLGWKVRLDIPQDALPSEQESIARAFYRLINQPGTRRITILSGVLSLVVYVGLFIQAVIEQRLISGLEVFLNFLAAPIGALAGFTIWAYCAFGNAMVLSFVKRVIYREHLTHLSVHWYRLTLTFISFVLTWGMIWWTTLPGPILALIMAFVVYHTLALPDETIDKAKRKEKNALALEDGEVDEETVEIGEAAPSTATNRLMTNKETGS